MSQFAQGEGNEEYIPAGHAGDSGEEKVEPANDNAEISSEDQETIDVMNGVADQVHEVYEHPSIERGLYKAIDYIDDSYLMEKARDIWNSDKFPDVAKWALLHIPQIHPSAPFIKIFVRSGLLTYNEDEVKDINSFDKMVMEKAISIGSLLEPALIPLTPLIKPIQRIMDAQDNVFEGMRKHLQEHRAEKARLENMPKAA